MTDLIERIKADRAAGTPGPWSYRPDQYDDWGVVKAGRFLICQARDPKSVSGAFLSECRKRRVDPWASNARRIARVPEMEQAMIDQAAEIERLRAALTEVQRDCRSRTVKGIDGCNVMPIGSTAWMMVCDVLQEDKTDG